METYNTLQRKLQMLAQAAEISRPLVPVDAKLTFTLWDASVKEMEECAANNPSTKLWPPNFSTNYYWMVLMYDTYIVVINSVKLRAVTTFEEIAPVVESCGTVSVEGGSNG